MKTLALLLLLLLASCISSAPSTAPAPRATGDAAPAAARVLDLVNEARAQPRR